MIAQEKLNNISKLTNQEVLQIFHECEEVLGLVDIAQASEILSISKRRVYQLMNNENTIHIGAHKFIMLNCMK